jgi:DNA polymerase-3 subunit delta'
MNFTNVIGQSRTKDYLRQLNQSGRVPHALMFLGPTGGGSLALALSFAQLLQCENPGESGACEQCNPCRKAGQFTHPDIHFSYPCVGANAVSTDFLKPWRVALAENPYLDVNSWLQRIGAENKQGNINKEECNAIIKKLSLKIFEGRFKILLMWLPEYLDKEGNRLLKLIEEPPEQTIFLLVAENQDRIINTILSRCQLVKTEILQDAEVQEALEQQMQIAPDRARQIAFLAAGDFNQALEIAENPQNDDAKLLVDWLRKCYSGNGVEMVKWTDEFARLGRENQKQFLQYGLHFLRELMVYSVNPDAGLRFRDDEQQTAKNIAKVLDFDKITQLSGLLNDNIYYVERNANPKILLLDTSIRIHQILKSPQAAH